ncbi:MAG: type IV toxin-antitoxin system AbiEi family antitoxin domain-containing protein [Planctomycetota bacterium]
MVESKTDKVLEVVRKKGVVRPRDLKAKGIPQDYLWRLHRRGLLARVGRGLYTMPMAKVTENHSLVEAAQRVPHGVICLLSSLRFHGVGTQLPREVWVAIERTARRPKSPGLSLRVVRFSGKALTSGVEDHVIEGVDVRVYNLAKTVADCFKYRNKIGLDVAIEALRESRATRRATMDELWAYAKVCRVARVMRPYLEAIS